MNCNFTFRYWLSILLFAAFSTNANQISEQTVIIEGLKKRYDIRIIQIEKQIASVSLDNARTVWFPKMSGSVNMEIAPKNILKITDNVVRENQFSSFVNNDSLGLMQYLPGGGYFESKILFNNEVYFNGLDSTLKKTSLSLGLTQPLIRNAWNSASVHYDIKLVKIENKKLLLEQKKRILSFCSDIRIKFWNLFETQTLVSVYKKELEFAAERMTLEKTRIGLGRATILDTLTAKLALVNAHARLHDAESALERARQELSFLTGISKDSMFIDSTIQLETPSSPLMDSIFYKVEQHDIQQGIYELILQKLNLIRDKTKNNYLPDVNIKVALQPFKNEDDDSMEKKFNNFFVGLMASYAIVIKQRKLELTENNLLIQKTNLEREQYQEQQKLRILELSHSWERERTAIEISLTAQQVALQALDASRKGFSLGSIDRVSLDRAEYDYRYASVNLLKKQLLMKQLEVILDELSGLTCSRFGVDIQ